MKLYTSRHGWTKQNDGPAEGGLEELYTIICLIGNWDCWQHASNTERPLIIVYYTSPTELVGTRAALQAVMSNCNIIINQHKTYPNFL